MSAFHDLTIGSGIPNVVWVAVRFTGNTIAKELYKTHNYSTALAMKLRHKHRNQITLELWGYGLDGYRIEHHFGDESNWNDLKENVKTLTV